MNISLKLFDISGFNFNSITNALFSFWNIFQNFRDYFIHHPMFTIGILLVIGYFMGKLSSKIALPEITGFIITGLILGPYITGFVSEHSRESFDIVTEIALGFIALTIGGEFSIKKLKTLGKNVIIITLIQLIATFGLVAAGLFIFKMQLPFALLLGAIASATAPAATVAVVQSLRARGLFVDYLYGIVALDDAGCVILFGIIFSIATSILHGTSGGHGGAFANILLSILHSFGHILISIIMGAVSAFLIHFITKNKSNENEIKIIALGIIFLVTGIAVAFGIEPLLLNMAAGAVLINLSARNHRIFRILKPITPPIYALFFIMAGAELNPTKIFNIRILFLGGLYILFRMIGKYGGVYLGCLITKTSQKIKTFLGFCMLPQAGVALALALIIRNSNAIATLPSQYSGIGDTIVNIVLLSVFINELIGPPLSKFAIINGNEMEE